MSAEVKLHIGQIVKVGTGKKFWTVVGFWTIREELFADLQEVDRWAVHTSVAVGRCIPV